MRDYRPFFEYTQGEANFREPVSQWNSHICKNCCGSTTSSDAPAQDCLSQVWGVQRDYWGCLREGGNPLESGWSVPKDWKRGRNNSGENSFGTPSSERRKRRLTLEGY